MVLVRTGRLNGAVQTCTHTLCIWEARWPKGRASDSIARGRGSILTQVAVFCLSKIYLPPKSTEIIPRKRWLRPDMTEKLFTGTLSKTRNEIYVLSKIRKKKYLFTVKQSILQPLNSQHIII